VGVRLSGVIVLPHDPVEALALGNSEHVDQLAGLETGQVHFGPRGQVGRSRPELAEREGVLPPLLLERHPLRLVGARGFALTPVPITTAFTPFFSGVRTSYTVLGSAEMTVTAVAWPWSS